MVFRRRRRLDFMPPQDTVGARRHDDIVHPSAVPFILVHLACFAAIWTGVDDGKEVLDRLLALPGFGGEKAKIFLAVLGKRLTIRGFTMGDHLERAAEFGPQFRAWLREGAIVHEETVIDGLAEAPRTLLDMVGGAYTGKTVVRLGS